MADIKYQREVETVDYHGHSVREARETFQALLDIPDHARAWLNGRRVKYKQEPLVILGENDELVFVKPSHTKLILLVALLMAFSLTGGAFAIGYLNSTVSISVTLDESGGNFVDVAANNSIPISWAPYGNSSGDTGNGTLWDIDTKTSNFAGDITATIYLTNIDKMSHVYKGFGMYLVLYDSLGNQIDINDDSVADSSDYAFLSLKNGVVDLYIAGSSDIYTVMLDSGFYVTQPYDPDTWTIESVSPQMFIEMSQR